MDGNRRVLALVALAALVVACTQGERPTATSTDTLETTATVAATSTTAAVPAERQLGVYVTPKAGLLEFAAVERPVVAAGDDVVLTIAFVADRQQSLPASLPDDCVVHFSERPPAEATASTPVDGMPYGADTAATIDFGIDVDIKQDTRRVAVGDMVTWSYGTVTVDGCDLERGPTLVHFGRLTIRAASLQPGIWQVFPGAHRWPGAPMPPPSSLRTPAQFAYGLEDTLFAEQWVVGPAGDAPVDPLADEYTELTRSLPRSDADRPDDEAGPQLKVLYVVPTWATDRRRDTNGEIAQMVFAADEWLASQNGGFGMRLDTYEGALDIAHVSLDVTEEEWVSWFAGSLVPGAERLRALGWPIGEGADSHDDHLYFVVWEAYAGNYTKTGVGLGTCRPTIDALNRDVRMVGYAVAMADGSPCALTTSRFPFDGSPAAQRDWFGLGTTPVIDQFLQSQRLLPGCGVAVSPFDGQPHVSPSGDGSIEIRGGFIRDLLEPQDPLAIRMPTAARDEVPTLDVRHDTYFHITSGTLATVARCNSDASTGPLWSDRPLDDEGERTLLRSSYDRADDVDGRQLHFVYAVRNGTPDRAFDTGREVVDAVTQMQDWLAEEAGGTTWRVDTFDGQVDVTYFPLPPSVGDPTGKDCAVVHCPSEDEIEAAFVAAGRAQPDKVYVFLYDGGMDDGGAPGPCGISNHSAAFIHLDDAIDPTACATPWSSDTSHGWSVGLLVAHELFHTLGAVCPAGASAEADGHSTDRDDLMFAGSNQDTGNLLDPGRDDYWGVTAGCTDQSADAIFVRGD